jgi:hypothetical protein
MSETVTSDGLILLLSTVSTHLQFLAKYSEWDVGALKFGSPYYQLIPIFSLLKGLKLDFSTQDP